MNIRWAVTDGVNVKFFDTHIEAQEWVRTHDGWYELMA